MEPKRIPRILVARPGLNGHDRNAMAFALAFRDAGFEVIYTGCHQTPQQIVSTAIQEDVDTIALSIPASAHTFSFQRILELLKENGAGDITVIGSGNFSIEAKPGDLVSNEAGVRRMCSEHDSTTPRAQFYWADSGENSRDIHVK